jgi:hypothetical protein
MDEHFATVNAEPKGYLMQATAFALETGDGIVYAVVRDQTAVNPQEAVAPALDEADLASAFRGEAHMVTVTPGVFGPDCGRDRWIVEASKAAELFTDDMPLERQLTWVCHVLPLAAAALTEEGARRRDTVRRGGEHFDDSSERDARAAAVHLDDDRFSSQSVVRENRAGCWIVSNGPALECHVGQLERHALRRIKPDFSPAAAHVEILAFAMPVGRIATMRGRARYIM